MKFQFSLRWTMLGLLVACFCLAFYVRPLELRRNAIKQIEHDSGSCVFRNSDGSIRFVANGQVPWNVRVGKIYLTGVKERRTAPPQASLSQLKYLHDARFLSFNSSAFADRHVHYLDEMTSLRDLQLNGTDISEVGLQHLAARHRLRQLTLNDTWIDDGAIDALVSMQSLRELQVRHTGLTRKGIERLTAGLPNCEISH